MNINLILSHTKLVMFSQDHKHYQNEENYSTLCYVVVETGTDEFIVTSKGKLDIDIEHIANPD